MRKWCTAIEIILGIVFLCALDLPYRHDILLGHNDFSTFYAGAKLARTPALYNHEIVRRTVRAGWPDSPEQEVYLRAPFYAVLLSPLAALPYRTALLIFTGSHRRQLSLVRDSILAGMPRPCNPRGIFDPHVL